VRVLFVDLETEWRGGQNQALLMLKGLRALGHEAELLTVAGSGLEQRAEANCVPVHVVNRLFKRAQAAIELRILLSKGRFDILHFNEPHALTAGWLAGAQRRVPMVVSRRVGYPISKGRLARRRYEATAKIIAISKWTAQQAELSGVPPYKLAVVYEGVEIPQLPSAEMRRTARAKWGIRESAPLLGSVGALSPDKGQEWLIRALPRLKREFPECHLLLAGDGPDRSRLTQLAETLGISEAVVFAGFIQEIELIYAALDVFLFPSMFEGLGTSLLAAMGYGVPAIAFNCCALGEIIEQDKSGILVPVQNLEQIENAVAQLLRDSNYARKLGDAGRQRIQEKFSADKMVDGMMGVYREALANRMAPRR
jgi:L-malate glycosyltransferase